MATGSDTKATQTEEEVKDFLHLREEHINFKCAEGIPAKLLKFRAFHEKGFIVRIELNGRLYCGAFLEVNNSHSFAPINLITTKRRRRVLYKKNKTRSSGVTRTKNPNTFCRENFPVCFVDAYNTIEARLRYGRDKKIPGFNGLLTPAHSISSSKDDSILKSNRKKKSRSVAVGSASNMDSSISSASSNRKERLRGVVAGSASNTDSSISFAKSNRKKKSRSVAAGLASNMDSLISSANSNRKKRSGGVVAGSASTTDSSIISGKSNRKKKSRSVVAGFTSNMDSSISSAKSNRKQRAGSVVAESASNMDSSISCSKSKRKKKSQSGVAGSASNINSSISSAKSKLKKKSRSVTAGSVSNSDCSITSRTKHKTKRKYCKRNENDVSETSNESSSSSVIMLFSNKDNGETSGILSDTSFPSVAKMTNKKDENQTNFNFLWAMQSQPRDLNSGPGCMVSTPRTDTDALSMNIDDTLRSAASNGSFSRMSPSDLITFSPEINTEKQCRKGHQSIESLSTSPHLSEPDLICFSPEIKNETNFKTKVTESPSVIQNIGLDLLFSPRSEVSSRTSETVSSQFYNKELVYKPDKINDVQFIENGDNILKTNKKSGNQYTESKLQTTRGMKDGPINNLVLNKITLNKGDNSSESKLQYKSDFDEIQGTNSSLKIEIFNQVNQREKCSKSHGEMIGVKSNIYYDGKFNLDFESTEKNTTDQRSNQILVRDIPTSNQYISQNNRKVEGICSKKNTVMKIDPPKLSESRFPKNSEIQCINDNSDLKEIVCQFPFEACLTRKTSNDSKNKENVFDISKNASQRGVSSNNSFHQIPDSKLKSFQRDVKVELGYNYSDVLAVENSCPKSQSSFDSVKHVLEDTNVSSRVQKEVSNSKGTGKTEVKGTEVKSLNKELPIQNSFKSKLQCGSIKNNVAKNVENEALDNVFNELQEPFNSRNVGKK